MPLACYLRISQSLAGLVICGHARSATVAAPIRLIALAGERIDLFPLGAASTVLLASELPPCELVGINPQQRCGLFLIRRGFNAWWLNALFNRKLAATRQPHSLLLARPAIRGKPLTPIQAKEVDLNAAESARAKHHSSSPPLRIKITAAKQRKMITVATMR
jgi:hypothetical protein